MPSDTIVQTTSIPNAWPEDSNGTTSLVHLLYRRWTYSYMNRILDKGRKQMLKQKNGDAAGVLLTQNDLYLVSETMKAQVLSEKFRYV